MLVAGIAALTYCSWPLGLVFNRSIAEASLASTLEARGQPFSWLFIALDCVTGASVLIVVRLQLPLARGEGRGRFVAALVAYGVFGLVTAADALVPLDCSSDSLRTCNANLGQLSVDDVLTGVAVLSLFIGAVCVLARLRRLAASRDLAIALASVVAVWGIWGIVLFAEQFSNSPPVLLQRVFLVLTAGLLFAVPSVALETQLRLNRGAGGDLDRIDDLRAEPGGVGDAENAVVRSGSP